MTLFIPAVLAKLTVILAIGLMVAASSKNLAPSLRHLILFAVVSCSLALPVVMLLTPPLDAPILPRSPVTAFSPSAGSSSEFSRNNGEVSLTDAPIPAPVTTESRSGSALTATFVDAPPAQAAFDFERIVFALPIFWAVGVIGVLAWLVTGRIRLRRIARTSWPLDDADWKRLLEEERKEADVDKSVRLFSSSVVSTPLTWGWRAPVILLPEDALDWPEEHRRVVLRHELAHVARGDAMSQLVAGFACALYWFHPLVWMTERRLRAECERACDDRVVSLGTPPAEYAAHLLEVARSARAFGAPGFLSVAMARPSQLEGRLLAVLNESRRRVSLSRSARVSAAALSALVLLPLAAFRAVPRQDEPLKGGVGLAASDEAIRFIEPSLSAAAPVAKPIPGAATESAATETASANVGERYAKDTAFQLSAPVRTGGTLNLDLRTGGNVIITGWDRAEVRVRASLGGRDWRTTRVTLQPSGGDAQLESEFTRRSNNQSTSHSFEIQVPRNFNVRIKSAGGSISIEGVNGLFTGQTGGGGVKIQKANGDVDIRTGGGEIYVSNSNLTGTVSTGGGLVRIIGVNGNLSGYSGSGPVIYTNSTGGKHIGAGAGAGKGESVTTSSSGNASSVTTYSSDIGDGPAVGSGSSFSTINMSSAGGAISLPSAPDGARVTTGGGRIRIGPSGGKVHARTGGGDIDIGPASGSVEAHTGAGDVTIELKGPDSHSVDVTSGRGEVTLLVPPNLNATLELESAYTNNLGHRTQIESDWPLTPTETSDWDGREGTPRRYVRVRQNIGRGGAVIRVRTVNGNVVLRRSR